MDTVRFDRTTLGNNSRNTTPNLAALAKLGTRYDHAYANGNESLYSHASLFTGLYPSEIAIPDYKSFAIPDGVPTLASILGAYGYATGAFTGGGHIIKNFGFNKGFSVFQAAEGGTRFASFFESVPQALSWIRQQKAAKKPWFAFVHGYDAHTPDLQRGPYLHPWRPEGVTPRIEGIVGDPLAIEQLRGNKWFPDRTPGDFVHAAGRRVLSTDFYGLPAEPMPKERVEELLEGELFHLRDHYDSGLLYEDVWLGMLLSEIDLSNTLVIVLSDHGEDLLDHGYMSHRAGLWDSTLHVPLVVVGPGFSSGKTEDRWVDLRRVLPTILQAVGAQMPAGITGKPLQQKDFFETEIFSEGVMDEVSVRDANGRLTFLQADLPQNMPELTTLDPQQNPRFRMSQKDHDQQGPVLNREDAMPWLKKMIAWRNSLHPAATAGAEISPELKEELQKHGYWTP